MLERVASLSTDGNAFSLIVSSIHFSSVCRIRFYLSFTTETEIDWTAMVSLRDILRMLGIPLAAAVVKTKDAPAEDEKEQGTTEEAASAATPENVVLDSPGDSDAFRIPSENASSAKAAQSTKPLKKELGKSPQMFLDHVCTLFPSLLKHVSGEIDGDDPHPFVTINPV